MSTNNQFQLVPLPPETVVHVRIVNPEPGIKLYPSSLLIADTVGASLASVPMPFVRGMGL